MDLESFVLKMLQRADDLPKHVNQVKQEVAAVTLETVAAFTPVDTSNALSNWQVGLGSASAPVIPPHSPGKRGSTRQESLHATIAAGTVAIKSSLPGQAIHIANGVDYIKELNDGTLSQAPGGFVETAILVGRQTLATAKVIPD